MYKDVPRNQVKSDKSWRKNVSSSFSPPLPREWTKAAFVCQTDLDSFSERNWAQQLQIGGHERQQLPEFLLHLLLSLDPAHPLRPTNHKASSLRWCYTGRFAASIFSVTKRCNVGTMLQLFEIMLHQCCNVALS